MNAVAERFPPGLAASAESLFAGIAVPLGTIGTNATAAQYVSFLREVDQII
jgi:hypothetical protein